MWVCTVCGTGTAQGEFVLRGELRQHKVGLYCARN